MDNTAQFCLFCFLACLLNDSLKGIFFKADIEEIARAGVKHASALISPAYAGKGWCFYV